MRVASWSRSARVMVVPNSSSSFSFTTPEQEFRICKKASYSPWMSEIKCSVPLGRPKIAWRLMISVLAACTVGYCFASSRRYSSSWG